MRRIVLVLVLAFAAAPDAASAQARQPEVLHNPPSGFWTSNRPAEGGAYRWRLLGIGVVIAGVMGLVIYRVLRSPNVGRRERR